jgi:hypothetical protein
MKTYLVVTDSGYSLYQDNQPLTMPTTLENCLATAEHYKLHIPLQFWAGEFGCWMPETTDMMRARQAFADRVKS